MRRPELVLVEWDDAVALVDDTWPADKKVDELKPARMEAVGWLVRRDKRGVVLAMQFEPAHKKDEDYTWGGVWCVPKGMVKRIQKLVPKA